MLGPEQVPAGAAGREQREVALGVLAAASEDPNSSSDRSGVEMYRRELFRGQDPWDLVTDWLWRGERGEERAAGFLARVRWCVEIGRFQEGGGGLAHIHRTLTVLACMCVTCDQNPCSTPGSRAWPFNSGHSSGG